MIIKSTEIDKEIINQIGSRVKAINKLNPLKKQGEMAADKIIKGIDSIADVIFDR